jgi:hypothetical protein
MLKKKSTYVMAILGATGAVGKETLEILDERKFPIAGLRLFASKRSAGEVFGCQDKEWTVEELTPESSFAGVDIALISATDDISRDYGERLGKSGVVVIDDSGVFRMEARSMRRHLAPCRGALFQSRTARRLPWSWRSSRCKMRSALSGWSSRRFSRCPAPAPPPWTNW